MTRPSGSTKNNAGSAGFDVGLRFVGPIFVVFASVLIGGVIWTWFTYIEDQVSRPNSIERLFHLLCAFTLISNLFWNYWATVLTPPGGTPDDYEHPPLDIEGGDVDERRHWDGFGKWCKKCRKPKPPRVHHCSICRRCVLKMDHHCPWVAGCVGHRNYRTFFLFMTWLWLGCIYVLATMAPSFWKLVRAHSRNRPDHNPVVFSFILAFSVAIAVGILLAWHVYLLLTGQTTIEWYNNRMLAAEAKKRGKIYINRWDQGWFKNAAMVLGSGTNPYNSLYWLWPTLKGPYEDGVNFAIRQMLYADGPNRTALEVFDPRSVEREGQGKGKEPVDFTPCVIPTIRHGEVPEAGLTPSDHRE